MNNVTLDRRPLHLLQDYVFAVEFRGFGLEPDQTLPRRRMNSGIELLGRNRDRCCCAHVAVEHSRYASLTANPVDQALRPDLSLFTPEFYGLHKPSIY